MTLKPERSTTISEQLRTMKQKKTKMNKLRRPMNIAVRKKLESNKSIGSTVTVKYKPKWGLMNDTTY